MPINDIVPFIGAHLAWSSRTSKHSPEELEKLKVEYRDSLGLSDNVKFSSDAFDNHVKGRIKDFNGFTTAKTPTGESIHQKLSANPPANANVPNPPNSQGVISVLGIIFKPTDDFETAQREYKESVATFNQLKKQVPETYQAQDLIGLMTELKSNAKKAILAQQEHEKQLFLDHFKTNVNPDFITILSSALNLKNQADIDTTKNNLLADLDASHKKQITEFDKSTDESLKKLHEAATTEISKLLFIANLYKNTGSEEMRQTIIALGAANAARKRQEAGLAPDNVTVDFNQAPDKSTLQGISIDDLKTIKSITGKEIINNGNGTFTLHLPKKIFDLNPFGDPFYYLDPRQNTKNDVLLMANAVKASGYDKIKMSVNYENQDIAMERGREAYEASIKAGFAPEKITVAVNGKEMKAGELFKDHQQALTNLHQQSGEYVQKYANLAATKPTQNSAPTDLTKIKDAMRTLREQNKLNPPADDEDLGPPAKRIKP